MAFIERFDLATPKITENKRITIPDDFGENHLRWICEISNENDMLTSMTTEDGGTITCPVNCEVVKDKCVYPLPEKEIIRELQKGPQNLTFAEVKFIMNTVKSDSKVQEIIGTRHYTYDCCVYVSDFSKMPPSHIIGITLNMQDNNETFGIGVDLNTLKVIEISTDTFESSSGEPSSENES